MQGRPEPPAGNARSQGTDSRRLDVLLVERGLAPTREKAQAVIMAGQVRLDGQVVTKAGTRYPASSALEVIDRACPFVSRGGWKLARALEAFGIDVREAVCLDVGASTGGFTDCLLQRGALHVYAVDVGYGQLDASLRVHPRVVCLERLNARALSPEHIDFACVDFACVDVSFISLANVLPAVVGVMAPDATLVTLVKPQFEAGRKDVGKKGVVRDPDVHLRVLLRAMEDVRRQGLGVQGLAPSPLRGPAGNIEFLLWATRRDLPGWDEARGEDEARRTVAQAHDLGESVVAVQDGSPP